MYVRFVSRAPEFKMKNKNFKIVYGIGILVFTLLGSFEVAYANTFTRGLWMPYWHEHDGPQHLMANGEDWDEVSPFSFEVNNDGTLKETMKFNEEPWKSFITDSHAKGKKVILTIAWLRGSKIHDMLSTPSSMLAHVNQIQDVVKKYPELDGIDIDYEGKWVEDKDAFSNFIRTLGGVLKTQNKILSCTVEPRITDTPRTDISEHNRVTLMSWANDYVVLNEVCDQVRIMTYDQSYFKYGDTKWNSQTRITYQLLSSTKWVKDVLTYTKKYVDPNKLYLGIPTYGYEVSVKKTGNIYQYQQKGAYTYARALTKWPKMKLSRFEKDPKGDGWYHIGTKKGWVSYLVISDAIAIKEKTRIAKEAGIRGTYLFSAFGKEDPKIWQ